MARHPVPPSQFLRAHGVSPRAKTISFAQTQRVYCEDANHNSGSREAHRAQRNAPVAEACGTAGFYYTIWCSRYLRLDFL
jgi:hypothetical protein